MFCAGCESLSDVADGDVYLMTFEYEPGDNAAYLWQFLQHKGAEECMDDQSLGSVRFKINNLPEAADAFFTRIDGSRVDCDELERGYPYRV